MADAVGSCVLAFHRVVDTAERDHDLAWPTFIALLDDLVTAGARFSTSLPATPETRGAVVLTFDDGTPDHERVGRELADRRIAAIFFVSAGLVGADGFLAANAVRALAASGHVVGSHGLTHRRLDRCSEAEVEQEVHRSREVLEAIGGQDVTLFAPAGGIVIDGLGARLEAAGYLAARTMRWGVHADPAERWSIPSLPVTELTVTRGWIASAARHGRLPATMVALRTAKDILPDDTRTRLRGVLTRAFQRPG